ncbi:MAG: hypothetical protein AAFY41_03730 [Bacteroidota bacterium]
MSDEEFEVIDELYFVTSYQNLKSATDFDDDPLKSVLIELIKKGWVKIFKSVDYEVRLEEVLVKDFDNCYFLASKKGLLEHNS